MALCVKKSYEENVFISFGKEKSFLYFLVANICECSLFSFGVQWWCVAILQVFLIFFSIADAM